MGEKVEMADELLQLWPGGGKMMPLPKKFVWSGRHYYTSVPTDEEALPVIVKPHIKEQLLRGMSSMNCREE